VGKKKKSTLNRKKPATGCRKGEGKGLTLEWVGCFGSGVRRRKLTLEGKEGSVKKKGNDRRMFQGEESGLSGGSSYAWCALGVVQR